MPIRILQVVTTMDMGGIESLLMNLYRNIDREKVQFDFLAHRDFEFYYEKEIEELGGKIYRMMPITPTKIPQYNKSLRQFFKEHPEYKVVHSHLNAWSYMVLKSAKKCGVPVRIAHSHTTNLRSRKNKIRVMFIDYCRKHISKQTTHRFACSKGAGEWLYGKDHFKVFQNAIDADRFIFDELIRKEVRQELGLKDEILLGHIGRMDGPKNQIFLLQVLKELCKKQPDAKLLLIGDGELRGELEREAENLGLKENVIFTGARLDTERLLQAADVFCFPSKFEGLPVTMVEAQAAGLPCLMSDTVTDEIIVTDLVKTLPINNPEQWAQKILNTDFSKERRNTKEEIVKSGFDIKDTIRRLEEFYLNEYSK